MLFLLYVTYYGIKLSDTILEYVLTKVQSLLMIWLGSLQLFIPQPDNVHMYYTIQSMNWEGHRRLHVEVGRQGSYRRYDSFRYKTNFDWPNKCRDRIF